MADNTISLYKLRNKINACLLDKFNYVINQTESFKLANSSNPKYVEPIFSIQQSSMDQTSFEDATIILISAAGATGKTSLTEHLSNELSIPIFDLSKHDPVASNSLTGLLYNNMELQDFAQFSMKLKEGKSSMIIDALDEGFLKTTIDGFYSFLDDVAKMSNGAKGVPFIMLGRTNIVELVTLYLESKNVKVVLLQIEPFTVESAKVFIDKHVESEGKTKFEEQYKTVRDYIINAIGGFFKNQSEINHKQYLQFIGYAPVLLAISTLLNDNNNYHALLEDLKSSNRRNIQLVIDIIERILKRDKEEKIDKLLLPTLTKDRDESFRKLAIENVYTIEEQCVRLLCKRLNVDFSIPVTGDNYFDIEYNNQIQSWLDEHPFLSNGKIQNVVFESYIIAKLIGKEEYKEYVYLYLKKCFRNAYMLFYIFDELVGADRLVDKDFISYLFDSLKALDKKGHYSSMELTVQSIDDTSGQIQGEIVFFKADSTEDDYSYVVAISKSDTISIGPDISNLIIDLPVTIKLSSNKIDCTPPAYIKCDKILCSASDILLNLGTEKDDSVVLECKEFLVSCDEKGCLPLLSNKGNMDRNQLKILCENNLSYPFVDFRQENKQQDVPIDILEKYQKMRRTILMFRSHSKGDLARLKEKIDNRIGNSDIGKRVINALLNKGIIYSKEIMYFVNTDRMASELGIKYNDIRSSTINDKIRQFLLNV